LVSTRSGTDNTDRVAGRFEALGVARRRAVIEGQLDAARLPRLEDMLALPEETSDEAAPDAPAAAAELHYRIAGTADGAGRPALEITVSGSVPLTCQRCLQAFAWPVEQRTVVLLARDERELAQLDEEDHEHEVVLANAPLDPLTLVEDELLLTLPYVPRCADSACIAAHDHGSD